MVRDTTVQQGWFRSEEEVLRFALLEFLRRHPREAPQFGDSSGCDRAPVVDSGVVTETSFGGAEIVAGHSLVWDATVQVTMVQLQIGRYFLKKAPPMKQRCRGTSSNRGVYK